MDDRGAKIIKASPQIVACVIAEAFFHDIVVFLVLTEKPLGDYVFAPEAVIPKIAKGNEAEPCFSL
jgi:hypothetical protein